MIFYQILMTQLLQTVDIDCSHQSVLSAHVHTLCNICHRTLSIQVACGTIWQEITISGKVWRHHRVGARWDSVTWKPVLRN